ncbi:hypothetical protein JZL99_24920 [Escherichia coli]|uniref:hypothetical protein n=1 Tax=Escherichia coli TaxID=562 RepID=UPI0019D22484|nr:hypothetical protein [Escherichia coli]MBN6417291.1 hypothetical protein [Escherichia coli]
MNRGRERGISLIELSMIMLIFIAGIGFSGVYLHATKEMKMNNVLAAELQEMSNYVEEYIIKKQKINSSRWLSIDELKEYGIIPSNWKGIFTYKAYFHNSGVWVVIIDTDKDFSETQLSFISNFVGKRGAYMTRSGEMITSSHLSHNSILTALQLRPMTPFTWGSITNKKITPHIDMSVFENGEIIELNQNESLISWHPLYKKDRVEFIWKDESGNSHKLNFTVSVRNDGNETYSHDGFDDKYILYPKPNWYNKEIQVTIMLSDVNSEKLTIQKNFTIRYPENFTMNGTISDLKLFDVENGRINHMYYPPETSIPIEKNYYMFLNSIQLFADKEGELLIPLEYKVSFPKVNGCVMISDYTLDMGLISKLPYTLDKTNNLTLSELYGSNFRAINNNRCNFVIDNSYLVYRFLGEDKWRENLQLNSKKITFTLTN